MRTTSLFAVALLALSAACADAPITAADLQADGQLRARPSAEQNSFATAAPRVAATLKAEHLSVSGLLAAQAEGPLQDSTRFASEVEAIHLHLRADELAEPRPVTFVWIHGDLRRETMGFLQPSETLSLAASLPLRTEEGEPIDALGAWKVEVYASDSLLFEREFEILSPEQLEAEAAEAARGVVQ